MLKTDDRRREEQNQRWLEEKEKLEKYNDILRAQRHEKQSRDDSGPKTL